jgi:hypothetical protein
LLSLSAGKSSIFIIIYDRGIEIIEFMPYGNFYARYFQSRSWIAYYRSTASECEFTDIDLREKDWAGYDEEGVKNQ